MTYEYPHTRPIPLSTDQFETNSYQFQFQFQPIPIGSKPKIEIGIGSSLNIIIESFSTYKKQKNIKVTVKAIKRCALKKKNLIFYLLLFEFSTDHK
jgi:hypothetical protein